MGQALWVVVIVIAAVVVVVLAVAASRALRKGRGAQAGIGGRPSARISSGDPVQDDESHSAFDTVVADPAPVSWNTTERWPDSGWGAPGRPAAGWGGIGRSRRGEHDDSTTVPGEDIAGFGGHDRSAP